ncbi:unnamed protein product, partial [Mesorhabditis spiculigera]
MPENNTASPVEPLNTEIRIFYIQIISLDAENQILSTLFQTKMYWTDDRLAWDSEEYGGIDQLYLNEDLFWLPDVNIGNVKGLVLVHPDQIRTLRLRSDGKVMMPTVYFAETTCTIKDASSQILSTCLEIKMIWKDPRLAWDPDDYGGIEQMYLNEQLFWLPDTNVGNVLALSIIHPEGIRTVCVKSSGHVTWPAQYYAENNCRVKVGTFPFDTQLGIGLTSLVSMTVLLDMLSDAIPKTVDFPILGIYVVLCVGSTFRQLFQGIARCNTTGHDDEAASLPDVGGHNQRLYCPNELF